MSRGELHFGLSERRPAALRSHAWCTMLYTDYRVGWAP